jgi:hypothetical protein
MKNKIFIILFSLVFFSCKKINNLSTILTVPNCYWNIHDEHSSRNDRISYCYKFNEDGSCLYMFTPDKKGNRYEYHYGDDLPPSKTWQLQGDSIIYILGLERKVIRYSSDTILLVNPILNLNDTLVKDCNM